MASIHQRMDEAAVKACATVPMRSIDPDEPSPVAFWPYVLSLPPGELGGHHLIDDQVSQVYRCAASRFDHILIPTSTQDVYLAVVTDLHVGRVVGHRILDLRSEYGAASARGGRR